MNHNLSINDQLIGALSRAPVVQADLWKPKGVIISELYRRGRKIGEWVFENVVVNEGKNNALTTLFNSGAQITTWYMGLIDNTSYSSSPVTDTMVSHAGWIELTGYTQATRPEWDAGNAASQQITNASPVTFDINASGSVRGAFITSNNTKGGTTGILWATALYSATVPVASADQIKNTYTVTT